LATSAFGDKCFPDLFRLSQHYILDSEGWKALPLRGSVAVRKEGVLARGQNNKAKALKSARICGFVKSGHKPRNGFIIIHHYK